MDPGGVLPGSELQEKKNPDPAYAKSHIRTWPLQTPGSAALVVRRNYSVECQAAEKQFGLGKDIRDHGFFIFIWFQPVLRIRIRFIKAFLIQFNETDPGPTPALLKTSQLSLKNYTSFVFYLAYSII